MDCLRNYSSHEPHSKAHSCTSPDADTSFDAALAVHDDDDDDDDIPSYSAMALFTLQAAPSPSPSQTPGPVAEEEEYYSSWSLFLVCVLLIISLWTSYYLQIKRIRAIHETLVSIFAGMFVGFVVRLAPGHLIREMLVSLSVLAR